MDRRDSHGDRDIIPIHGRKQADPLAGGSVDPRGGDSAAREFAERALTPFINRLRNRYGSLDARRVASAIGMTVEQLAECLELPRETVKRSPPPPELEARLEPFAMVIGIVRDAYGGDDKRVRVWLRNPRPELDGRSPIETVCVTGGVQRVLRFVLSAWLGNAD
ncbi:MAG: hypothetical protein JWL95_1945 [Gemmatimonadetes bacterium]|nr:hypothetical protein [Gemmatimonadota bacterium]